MIRNPLGKGGFEPLIHLIYWGGNSYTHIYLQFTEVLFYIKTTVEETNKLKTKHIVSYDDLDQLNVRFESITHFLFNF